jgi:hypothetical protein
VESLILIYTLLVARASAASIYKLIDKEACSQKPKDGKPDSKICRAEVLDINVDAVLIRPLGHAFSAQLHVVLVQNLTLKEAHKILTKNKRCCIRKVWNRRNDGDSLS